MARAEAYFEDDEDGNLSFAVRYIGGEDPESGAHQMANACRRFLESNMQQIGPTQVIPHDPTVEGDTHLVPVEQTSAAPSGAVATQH